MKTAFEATLKVTDIKFKEKDAFLTEEEQELAVDLTKVIYIMFWQFSQILCITCYAKYKLLLNLYRPYKA